MDPRRARAMGVSKMTGGECKRGNYTFSLRNFWDVVILAECWDKDGYGIRGLDIRETGRATVLDIGANIGAFSAFVRHLHPDAKIIAFEPQPDNAEAFRKHVFPDTRTALVEAAVYGSIAPTSMTTGEDSSNSGAWKVTFGGPKTIEAISIHDILDDIPHVDIMKIDCEGSEFDILLSLSEAELGKIKYICGEFHPQIVDGGPALLERLKAHVLPTHVGTWTPIYGQQGIFRLERNRRHV